MGMRRITNRPGRADSEDLAQSQAPAARRRSAGGMLKAQSPSPGGMSAASPKFKGSNG
jgi:hypothetical protein